MEFPFKVLWDPEEEMFLKRSWLHHHWHSILDTISAEARTSWVLYKNVFQTEDLAVRLSVVESIQYS